MPKWKKLTDLKDFNFGTTRSYVYTKEFLELINNKTLDGQEATSDEQNFKKLSSGRIKLFPMAELTGWQIVANVLPDMKDKITTASKPLKSTTGHLIISKQHPKGKSLTEDFNKGLAEMRADGTYQQYLEDLKNGVF